MYRIIFDHGDPVHRCGSILLPKLSTTVRISQSVRVNTHRLFLRNPLTPPFLLNKYNVKVLWKRPTALHLLLRSISKDQVRRKEMPWGGGSSDGVAIELTDESLVKIVTELMPAGADGNGVSAEKWIAAIRKCPW